MNDRGGRAPGVCCAAQPASDLTGQLLSTYLFRDLSPTELEPLRSRTVLRHVTRNEPVFRTGETATSLFVVVDGQLKERTLTADGAETITEVFTAGAVFGEPGLFVPSRDRIVDVIAMTDSHLAVVPRGDFVRLLTSDSRVALRLIEGLSSDLRATTHQLTHAGYLRVRERVAAKLLELAHTHAISNGLEARIAVSLSQTDLAGMVAATRENVSRALADLAAQRAVRTENAVIYVDLQRLRALIELPPVEQRRNRLNNK